MHSILVVNWFANRSGGAESYTHDLAMRLTDRGHRVSVACVAATPELASRVSILPLYKPQPRRLPLIWRLESLTQYASVAYQMSQLSEVRPDIVLNSLPFAANALRKRFPSASHVYFPHAMISPIEVAGYQTGFAARLAFALYSHAERRAILQSAATVRFTEHNRKLMKRFYRLPKSSRFAIIPAAVEVPLANAKPASGGVQLLFVGRLVASKNVRYLIECLAELTSLPWTLDIVGDGPERKALEDLADDRALTSRVHFHGHQPDPSRFYVRADLFVFPSLLENFPLVLLEAMAHHTPALAFANDGARFRNSIHELIRNPNEGTLVPDEAAFKAALERFLSHPTQLGTLGRNARSRVIESHSWPVVLQQWDDLFDCLRSL